MTGCIYKLPDGRCDKPGKYMAFCIGEACQHQTPTNYDLLISKTPEEMAMWMLLRGCPTEEINESCMNNKTKEKSCTRCWLDWLKSPVEPVEVGE